MHPERFIDIPMKYDKIHLEEEYEVTSECDCCEELVYKVKTNLKELDMYHSRWTDAENELQQEKGAHRKALNQQRL